VSNEEGCLVSIDAKLVPIDPVKYPTNYQRYTGKIIELFTALKQAAVASSLSSWSAVLQSLGNASDSNKNSQHIKTSEASGGSLAILHEVIMFRSVRDAIISHTGYGTADFSYIELMISLHIVV
jgi:hypothetical protein